MKPATLRIFRTVHTWTGLIAGLALFIAFYAGAITVFRDDIAIWEASSERLAIPESLETGQALLDRIVTEHPAARESIRLILARPGASKHAAYWLEDGEWQHSMSEGTGSSRAELSIFLYRLHYSLGLPLAPGKYLMGVICMIYGLAIVSGLILCLPTFTRDLFALRIGPNIKRMWQDAHTLIGVFSLPFHVVIALSAAVICLGSVVIDMFDRVIFEGALAPKRNELIVAAPPAQAAGMPATMMTVADILYHGQRIAPDHDISSLRFEHYGDANARVSLVGTSPRTLDGSAALTLSAVDGRLIGIQIAGQRDANHAVRSALYSLHFANYGDHLVRIAYFLLSLAGAFLFYSGNLLWIESRRKRSVYMQPRLHRWMARITVGIAFGCCIGVSTLFVATQLAPLAGVTPGTFERALYLAAFLFSVLWAACRQPARAASELALIAASVTAAIPISNMLMTGDHLVLSAQKGLWSVFGVDLAAIALAFGFWRIARITRRRGARGETRSVWAIGTPS